MKRFHSFLTAAMSAGMMMAGNPVTVGGVSLEADTTCHVKIGPGVTRTSLHLSGTQPLDVHYITIDTKAPGIRFRGVRAASSTGLEKTSEMGKRLNDDRTVAIAGINGDFFDVTATYADGSVRPRMTTYTTITDNDIYRTSPQAWQFVVDHDGRPMVTSLDFSQGIVKSGEKSVSFGGVNVESVNYSGDAAPDNAVTLYDGRGWKSVSQTQFAGKCAEVSAIPVDDCLGPRTDTPVKYRIISGAADSGDAVIPEGGCVLFGRGDGETFLRSLAEGDIVEIQCSATLPDGNVISPALAIGGNPRPVIGGVAQESDGTRPDAVELHPRTGVGVSVDGSKVIMMTVDGRGLSVGVTTRQLGDLLVYAGAEDALNFDGGGSSTCWTGPFGVVNTCSDASGERTVADALFVTAEGDVNDTRIAEIGFEEWRHDMVRLATWRPRVYGYNAAGVLVNDNLEGFTLTCAAEMGEVMENGTFYATGTEGGALTAEYNGLSASVIVGIHPSAVSPRISKLLLDNKAPYAIELIASADGGAGERVDTRGFSWTSEDERVAKVDMDGIVTGISEGTTTINGEMDDIAVCFDVTVEIPSKPEIPLCGEEMTWSCNGTQVKNQAMTFNGEGFDLDYTMGTSVASASVVMVGHQLLYSRPESIRILMSEMSAKPKKVTLVLSAANTSATVKKELTTFSTAGETEWKISLSDLFDVEDASIWPVELVSMQVSPGDPAKAQGHICFKKICSVYSGVSGVYEVMTESAAEGDDCVETWYTLTGLKVDARSLAPGVYIRKRGGLTEKVLVK